VIDFFVRRSILVNSLMILVCASGVWAALNLPMEAMPLIVRDVATVITAYPGVSSAEVERLVTMPLEEALENIEEIDEISSTSVEGRSVLVLNIEADSDLAKVVLSIQNEVNRVTLPEGVTDAPVVKAMARQFTVLRLALSGGRSFGELRDAAKRIRDRLRDVPGVAAVEVGGVREPELAVEVAPDKLEALSLTLGDVTTAIRNRNLNMAGGKIRDGGAEILLRTQGELGWVDEIREVVVRSDSSGHMISVGDLATVRPAFEESTLQGHVNGRRSVNLVVKKRADGNTITIVDSVRALLPALSKSCPKSINLSIVNDGSRRIRRRLKTMNENAVMGLILVVVLLYLTMNARLAFFTALGLPVAFAGALVLMYLFGASLNLISMFGLIIVLGMLVDDGIVVSENVYRHMQNGIPAKEAAIRGAKEVFWPVLASVLTTNAAFLPLAMASGMMGQFLRWIPIVVVFALSASVLESFYVLPNHLSHFSGRPGSTEARDPAWLRAIRAVYTYILIRALRYRYLVFFGLLGLATAALYVGIFRLGFRMFPRTSVDRINLNFQTELGTSLESTERVMAAIETKILGLDGGEVEAVIGTAGESGDRGDKERASHIGTLRIDLSDVDDRTRKAWQIQDDLRSQIAGTKGLSSLEFGGGMSHGAPPVGRAVEVALRGGDLNELRRFSREVQEFLRSQPGVKDIRDDFATGKAEERVVVDERAARRRGLSLRAVAQAVREAYQGAVASKIQRGDEELRVRVRMKESFRRSLPSIERLRIRAPSGELVPFSELARVVRGRSAAQIRRLDGRRTVKVFADITKSETSSFKVNQALRERFSAPAVAAAYPFSSVTFGGEEADRMKSMKSMMRAAILAAVLIYLILASLFDSISQPLIVMCSVPLGFLGVVYGFILHGQPMSLMGIIGLIALSGVVVNDSIVFVDFINRSREEGAGRWASIVAAGRVRLRPILLTTITTIFGLLPMMLEIGGSASFLTPMAIAMVWGLGFATFLTLLLIPCLYAINDDLRALGAQFLKSALWIFGGGPEADAGPSLEQVSGAPTTTAAE